MPKKTLYVSRPVINHEEIAAWAKSQGFESTLGDDMHVTLAFSRDPVDWDLISASDIPVSVFNKEDRHLKPLGDQGAIVLRFEDPIVRARWKELKGAGAKWDWPEYQPHITLSYQAGDIDLSEIEPYMGKIELGPERLKEVNENWADEVKETPVKKQLTTSKIVKVDEDLGLVFGYAIVCLEKGVPHFDLQGDHIPESTMLKASLDFAENSQMAKDMHGYGNYGNDSVGSVPFLFPMTTEIAKALGIKVQKTGLLIAMKPSEDEILQKFKSGEYTGFSIGGEEVAVSEA